MVSGSLSRSHLLFRTERHEREEASLDEKRARLVLREMKDQDRSRARQLDSSGYGYGGLPEDAFARRTYSPRDQARHATSMSSTYSPLTRTTSGSPRGASPSASHSYTPRRVSVGGTPSSPTARVPYSASAPVSETDDLKQRIKNLRQTLDNSTRLSPTPDSPRPSPGLGSSYRGPSTSPGQTGGTEQRVRELQILLEHEKARSHISETEKDKLRKQGEQAAQRQIDDLKLQLSNSAYHASQLDKEKTVLEDRCRVLEDRLAGLQRQLSDEKLNKSASEVALKAAMEAQKEEIDRLRADNDAARQSISPQRQAEQVLAAATAQKEVEERDAEIFRLRQELFDAAAQAANDEDSPLDEDERQAVAALRKLADPERADFLRSIAAGTVTPEVLQDLRHQVREQQRLEVQLRREVEESRANQDRQTEHYERQITKLLEQSAADRREAKEELERSFKKIHTERSLEETQNLTAMTNTITALEEQLAASRSTCTQQQNILATYHKQLQDLQNAKHKVPAASDSPDATETNRSHTPGSAPTPTPASAPTTAPPPTLSSPAPVSRPTTASSLSPPRSVEEQSKPEATPQQPDALVVESVKKVSWSAAAASLTGSVIVGMAMLAVTLLLALGLLELATETPVLTPHRPFVEEQLATAYQQWQTRRWPVNVEVLFVLAGVLYCMGVPLIRPASDVLAGLILLVFTLGVALALLDWWAETAILSGMMQSGQVTTDKMGDEFWEHKSHRTDQAIQLWQYLQECWVSFVDAARDTFQKLYELVLSAIDSLTSQLT